jgi:hypothetical protein
MKKFTNLLQYLENVNSSREFVIRGKMPADKTILASLNGLREASRCEFSISIKKGADILSIDPDWASENGIVFDTISWSGGGQTTVNIYLNMIVGSIYVKSADPMFILKMEEYAHQIGFRVFSTS